MTLEVEEIDGIGRLEGLADEWHALLERVPHDSPYLTPEFMIPWARMLASKYRFRVLAVRDATGLVGLAPLFERRLGKWGVEFVVRSFPLHGFSPPFDLVIDPAAEGVVDAMLRHLDADAGWHLVELLNIPERSANLTRLRDACARLGFGFEQFDSLSTTYVPVEGAWPAYLENLPRKLRKSVRQGQRRLEQAGAVRFVRCPQDGLSLAEGIETALSVIGKSWKRFDAEAVDWNGFLREMGARLAARDMLCLRFLMVENVAAAYHLELDYRGNLHGLHNAYDLGMAAGNPGAVLLANALQDAHERCRGRFDFLGTKEYLERWAQARQDFVRLRVVNRRFGAGIKTALYDRVSRARKARAAREEEAQRLARLGRLPADADSAGD